MPDRLPAAADGPRAATPAAVPTGSAGPGGDRRPDGWGTRLASVLRGALIGFAEVVPGVSGGTIALVVGVYETLIRSAGHVVRGVAAGVDDVRRRRRTGRARAHLTQVRWSVVVPVLLGMVAAVLVGAAVLEPVLEEHPERARAVFAGLILASLVVPARMVGGRWRPREVAVGLLAAAAAFALTGLPPANQAEPALPVVGVAAAFAICALVVPGISGSFVLLTLGLYEPTLAAVNDRDLTYVGVFLLGATLGLALFVTGLQWLLEHHHRVTLVVMTGLMAGSLRALWPWQDADRGLRPPGDEPLLVAGLVLAGAAVVVALLLAEARVGRSVASQDGRRVADLADPPEGGRG